ncbi:Metallo-dependent phosphatase-like protein [Mariannaea sp. PMI_226]|nr:Metallo-dependent phosphatase-like protein [Mariannaea sp. PMI_226]
MKTSLCLASLALLLALVSTEDVLFSQGLKRRSLDSDGHYSLSFFHVNDVHAHLDEFALSGRDCDDPSKGCYGGYARIKHTVDQLRVAHPDNLWLNAGDEFQGTLFYTYYKGKKIAQVLNMLKFDAMTLGNHEWDGGDEQLGEFLQSLTFPVVSCNVRSEYEGLNKTIREYYIFEEHKLAVIGVTTDTTASISKVGNGTKFLNPIDSVQNAIWEIRNTTDIKRIVALTHIGYESDQELAAKTEGLSLIIGGHSHTPLGDMEISEGKYPTIIQDINGNEVFIVTAYRWGEYVGYIDVVFDDSGKALAYHGGPIHMDNSIEMDQTLNETIKAWRTPFEKFVTEIVGGSKVGLDQTRCQKKEDCLLGQVMADAMHEYHLSQGGHEQLSVFAFINAGSVRATIDKGNITRGDVLTSFPFGNAIVILTYTGLELKQIFEGAVTGINQKNQGKVAGWFQVSHGLKVEYNPKKKNGSKLINLTIGGESVEDKREYHMITLDFIASGGDNLLEPTTDFAALDTADEVLIQYLHKHSPLSPTLEDRVVATEKTAIGKSKVVSGDLS